MDSDTGPWCHGVRDEPGPAPSRSHGPRSLLAGRFANIYSYIDIYIYSVGGRAPGPGREREREKGGGEGAGVGREEFTETIESSGGEVRTVRSPDPLQCVNPCFGRVNLCVPK